MSVLLRPAALLALRQQSNVVLIDARTGPSARQQFEAQHLDGARFVDLETELAHKKSDPADGGRHPLPDVAAFCEVLGRLGIGPDTQVVVYDDKQGANAAARFWWMLSALGHPQVQVLDGGYQAAIEAGFPLSAGAEADAGAVPYPAKAWQWPTVGIETVERAVQDPGMLVIDVRDADRYAGKVEPIDLVAGHIPGAVNVPFSENLDDAGFFHSPAELRAKYTALVKDLEPRQVVVHCGSGVTACHTLLAFVQAGLEVPKLYVGSWSEWSRTNRPIGTKL